MLAAVTAAGAAVFPPPPQGPQMPCVLPWGTSQDVPGQQSALLVHAPQAEMHRLGEQT